MSRETVKSWIVDRLAAIPSLRVQSLLARLVRLIWPGFRSS